MIQLQYDYKSLTRFIASFFAIYLHFAYKFFSKFFLEYVCNTLTSLHVTYLQYLCKILTSASDSPRGSPRGITTAVMNGNFHLSTVLWRGSVILWYYCDIVLYDIMISTWYCDIVLYDIMISTWYQRNLLVQPMWVRDPPKGSGLPQGPVLLVSQGPVLLVSQGLALLVSHWC